MIEYKLDKSTLSFVEEPQLKLFESEFEKVTRSYVNVDYVHKSYKVNIKQYENDNKVNSFCFFSGAGGLDIGSQLAGDKVISSMDFDRDSFATLKKNKCFKHTKHFHKDIKEMTASDYEEVIKVNKTEKLILYGTTLRHLKYNDDGKIIGHIFDYQSLLDASDIFYIGDSKYYKSDNTAGKLSKHKHRTTLCISNSGFSATLKSKYINQRLVLSDRLVG